jgi:hypothetical protein
VRLRENEDQRRASAGRERRSHLKLLESTLQSLFLGLRPSLGGSLKLAGDASIPEKMAALAAIEAKAA